MAVPPNRVVILLEHRCIVRKNILDVTTVLQSGSNSPKRLFFFGYMLGRLHYIMQTLSNVFGYTMYHRLTHLKWYDTIDSYHAILLCHETTSLIDQGFALGYLREYLLIQSGRMHDDYLSIYTKAYNLKDYSHIKKIFLDSIIVNFIPPLLSLVKKVFPSDTINWKQLHDELSQEFQKMAAVI